MPQRSALIGRELQLQMCIRLGKPSRFAPLHVHPWIFPLELGAELRGDRWEDTGEDFIYSTLA
jgi:hypothetical protein